MQRTETEEERPNSDDGPNQHHPPHRHRRWLAVLQTMTLIVALLLAVYNHALIGLPQEETQATAWLVESEPFDPLAPCNEGGFRIHTGHDVNGNGLLDAGERQDSTVLCHGLRGLSGPQGQPGVPGYNATAQRMATQTIPPGNATCPAGGMFMQTGLDTNGNDALEDMEVVSEAVLCNGTVGQNGTHGSTGASALVDKTAAPNYLCVDGFVIRFGVDDGAGDGVVGNHVLEAGEAVSYTHLTLPTIE